MFKVKIDKVANNTVWHAIRREVNVCEEKLRKRHGPGRESLPLEGKRGAQVRNQ